MRTAMAVRTAAALAAVAALAACGSTVQVRTSASDPSASLVSGPATAGLGDAGTAGGSSAQPTNTAGQGRSTSGGARADVRPSADPVEPVQGLPATTSKVTGPITIGLMTAGDFGPATAALGGKNPTRFTSSQVARGLLAYYNAHGGLAGRRVVVSEFTLEPTTSNYETALGAACAQFTQDDHAAVVISTLENAFYPSYDECLSRAGVAHFAEMTNGADEKDLASFPGLVSATAPSLNDRFGALIGQLAESGWLTSKDKVGVVVEDCPPNQRVYSTTVAPTLTKLHIPFMQRSQGCIYGFGDAGSAAAAAGGHVLPFRSAGVTKVMFVSGYEGVLLKFFAQQAKSQGYEVGFALTSGARAAGVDEQYDVAERKRMRGVGWLPGQDVPARTLPSAAATRCLSMLASQGLRPTNRADEGLFYRTCDPIMLLEATLTGTRGRADRASLLSGLHALGSSYLSPSTVGGFTDYTSGRTGPSRFRIFGYRDACGCMDYLTGPKKR